MSETRWMDRCTCSAHGSTDPWNHADNCAALRGPDRTYFDLRIAALTQQVADLTAERDEYAKYYRGGTAAGLAGEVRELTADLEAEREKGEELRVALRELSDAVREDFTDVGSTGYGPLLVRAYALIAGDKDSDE